MQHKANRFNNKGKIVASLLLLALGTGAGSIAGTVAWYQYSTIATASYIATTAKASELLQIRVGDTGDDWKSVVNSSDIRKVIGDSIGSKIKPVTAGDQKKDAELNKLKDNPRYQYAETSSWGDAPDTSYLQFNLSFRVMDGEGKALEKDAPLYFSEIAFRSTADDVLSDALRIHIEDKVNKKYYLISKKDATIDTHGQLDLNGDGSPDTAQKYEWEKDDSGKTTAIDYGTSGTETSYTVDEMVATASNGSLSGGTSIGTIPSGQTLSLTFTIFLEGWEPLGEKKSAIWDAATYGGKSFGVGFSFIIPKLV